MKNFITAIFDSEESLVQAAELLQTKDIPIYDAYTPYPIHKMEEILNIRRSRLPIVTFIAGAFGCALALGFQLWVFKLDWPIIVGGKPFNAIPAFIPVAFETTVLLGGLVTVAAFFFRDRLFPGKKAVLPHPDVTDHQFALTILHADASLDGKELRAMLAGAGAVQVDEKEMCL